MDIILIRRRFTITTLTVCIDNCYHRLLIHPFTGDPKTEYIMRNGYILIYIDPGRWTLLTSNYGLCSLVCVRNQDSDKIHIILFDKPSNVITHSSLDKKYTFYELSYIDTFPQDKYVPNPPKLTTNLITQLISRTWKPLDITQFLYIIISLHANTDLIQEIINSNLLIDWGYIDSKGNTFLHKAYIHPQNADFLKIFIQNVSTHNNQLINHSNNAKQTPLALLTRYINKNTSYSTYREALNILLKHGAKILIQDSNTQMMRPIMKNFTIQQHNQSLVITFPVQQSRVYTNWSMYALISKPDEIFVINTDNLTSFSQKDLVSNVSKNFNIILDLNCPEILDYIFVPKNSISKTNISQSQTRESFLNITAGECNSPLLFEHFIRNITNWDPKNPKENILHVCLSRKKYENFYLLLHKIPIDVLNKFLYTPNLQNESAIIPMMDIPNTEKCTQFIIEKGCLDENRNNLVHIAISNKKYDFLRVMIKGSQTKRNTFTHENKDGLNPLHLAIQKYSIEATNLLLENSDKFILTSTNNDGYNCLHSAILHFNIDVFKAVLGVVIKCDTVGGVNIINIKTKNNTVTTPFLLSIETQCLEAAELLLTHGASIDIQDSKSQCFPYYIQNYCHTKGSLQKVLRLKVNQPNSHALKSEHFIEDLYFNTSPLLFYFWQYQDLDRFKEICAAFSFRNLVKCDEERDTILHLSLYNDKLTENLLDLFSHHYNDHKEETISFLDSKNKKGENVLSFAVIHSKPEAVQKILNLGVSLEIEFPGGDNILHIAIRTKKKETIAIFLRHSELGHLLCKPNDKKETPITSLLQSDGTDAINAIKNVEEDIHGLNGESILHLVVQNGDERTLLELIKSKRSSWSNLEDNNQRTPLHYAVEFSRAYAIKLLVERGYDIFTPDDKGNTPIHEAITCKNKEVWKEMFRILVSPNHVSQLPILLQFSVKMNNLNAVKNILSLKPDLTPDNDNNSIIHLAAKLPEQAAILEYLLQALLKEKSHHMLQSLNKDELTPLHYAVYLNNVKGAKILIENGSSIAVPFKRELSFFSRKFEGRMVLYKALHPNLRYLFGYSMKRGMENMYIMTEIPKLKSTDIYKVGALSRVTGLIPSQDLSLFFNSSCIDLISYLIQHKHVNFVYPDGITLLHYAAQFGTINIIDYLIRKHNCELFTLDKHENSILYYALQNQDHNLLKDVCQLITTDMNKVSSKQINLYETPNREGKRILEICLDSGNIKGFKHLLELVSDLLYFDMKGLTLLHHVIHCKQREEFIGLLIEKLRNTDRNLCTKLINLSITDNLKLAPLHVAVFHGSNNIVNILLKNGATPDVVNTHKQNALHYAVSRSIPEDNLKIVSSLLKYPKLLKMKDQHGQTPIFYCIDKENIPALTLLIEHPIDFHDEDKDKKTVIDHSIEKKNSGIWSIIFPKFRVAIVESKYIVTSTLKHLLQACMNKCNEVAFNDLLGLHLCTTFVEQEWRALIEFSITYTNVTFFLAEIISYLKTQRCIDLYFYPKSNQFTPPLLLAIQCSNIEAIKLMLKENISLSFTRSDKCLTLYSENCSTPLVFCIHKRINALLTGYKIVNSSPAMYVLVNLPVLGETNIYEHPEVTELKDLSIPNLTLILKSPSIEPIKSVIDLPSRYTYNLNKGSTLIHLAAKVASIEVLRYLLYNNSKITELDQDLNSVLHLALFNEIPDIFEILCNYLVDKLNYFKLFDCENASGKRILDICIEKRDLSSFYILLNKKYKVKLDYIDSRGYTLFHRLILLKTGVKFFKKLHTITHSTDGYQHLSSLPAEPSKLTTLHLAISENLHEHIDFILEQNYDLCVQSENGSYPIHVAVLKNLEKERIIKIISAIPKEKVSLVLNAQNNEGFSPLLLAARNGNVCTVEELLKRKSIRIDAVDNLGRNSLHHLILLKEDESNLELLKLFLKNKTLMKQKDSKGLTPPHYCVIQDNVQALELVLQNDIDILNESKEKKNIIHFAIESNSDPVWKRIFKELECSKDPKAIIEAKLNDQTILVYCIKKKNLTAFNDILTLIPDIDAVDSEGNTPLHHAAEYPEQSKILTSLIEYINGHYNGKLEQLFSILNNHNLAPFHYAIWKNNLSAIDIFISHKAPFVIEIKKKSKLTLCSLNSPLSINLYSSAQNNQLMIGYKVTPKSHNPPVWILSQIPDMKRDAIEKVVSTSIAKIHKLTDFHIKTILQCPSAEPVIVFLNQELIQESRTFDNGCSLLLYSAMYGTLSVVNELCKRMDLSFTDQNTETILFYALKNKDTEVLTILLNTVFELSKQSPSDILNAENKRGERILEVALNNFEKFSIVLDGKFKIILTYTNPNGDTLLHTIMRSETSSKFLTAILNEIQTREPGCLNKFINISSKHLQTALHLCVCNNLGANLRELLKFSPNITCQDQNENTPLHIASKSNFKSLVTILIEYVKSIQGDYPSFINAVNKEKITPLHLSIITSNLEIAEELLAAGAELFVTDNSGQTMLHYAVLIRDEIKREKAIDLLFQQEKVKADPERKLIQIQDTSNNDSPLHLAVLHSNNRTIQLLLKGSPDLTLRDKYKNSVLHQAITKGHLEIIQSILDYIKQAYPKERSDPLHVLNLQGEDGNTALHLVINGSRADILEVLLPLKPLMNLKNNSGQTPLHLAVSKKPEILKDILEEINKYSEEKKESYFYALDNTGLPPLHSAIVHNYLKSIRALIDSGAGLAWHKNNRHITLFNDTNGLSLCFCRLKKANTFKKLITHFTVNDIFVGYQMIDKNVWVVALLPGLTQTCVFPIQDIEQLTTTLEEAYILKSIVKCASTEPIKVGIQKRQIDDQKLDSEGNNWLKNFVISENGHKNVKTFVTFHNSSSRDLCAKLRTGVRNNDCLDVFEDVVEFIPVIRDDPESENEDIREISRTLLEVLPLSLENDKIDSLKKLLSLNPLLTHLYGENNDSTLLHLMVEKNKSSEFLEEYLEKVKIKEEQNPPTEKRLIDSKNSNSMTVLNLSIKMKQLKNIKTILSYKPNIYPCDASDNSILHFATKTSNLEIAQLITNYISNQNPSYSFDLKNSDGCTPLHLATESGNVEICELLLSKCADCYSTDNTSKTILHNAISIQDDTQRKSMIEFILQNTVNSDNKIVRMPDNQSCIPLQCAVAKGQVSVVELLVPITDTIKHRNIDKQTALHLSCIHRCDKIVDLIVDEIKKHEDGNVIDLREKNMKTALHLSIDNKNHHALEKVLKAKPNLELIDASKNNYLHNAIEVVDDPFFLRTILTNLSEDSIQNLFTRLNSVELPPLQYAILNKNYLAADILVGKGAKLDFQKEGKRRLCNDTDKLKLKVVEYKSQCWVGFEILIAKDSHFVITQLPSLEGDTYVSANDSWSVKPYSKKCISLVMQQICECESSDPFNTLLQNGLISLENNFQQIAKFATKEVIRTFFDSYKNALYHQSSGESMIESAVSNPNIDAFEFLLSNLPEFQQEDISSADPTDSKDVQISLCVKNSLRKSLKNTNTRILKCLLKRFTKINYLYLNEETLIHLAISQGNSPDFLEAIFENVGKDGTDIGSIGFVNKQSIDKKHTALHICIAKKQKENLKVLLRNSADLFLCDS